MLLWLVPPAIATGIWATSSNPWLERLENISVDWRFRARQQADPPADPRLLVVGIGELSLQEIGRWPWNREYHAGLLQLLQSQEPAVVAFDLLFTEPSAAAIEDAAMAEGLDLIPGAITGASADDAVTKAQDFKDGAIGKTEALNRVMGDIQRLEGAPDGMLPIPEIAKTSWTGFVNVEPSRVDGIRRELPLVIRLGEKVFPSFVLQALMQLEGARPADVEVELGREIRLTGKKSGRALAIPINAAGKMLINYRNPSRIPQVDYLTLMRQISAVSDTGDQPATPVRGRVLIVGQVAAGLTDFGPTPFSSQAALVTVQAAALDTILRRDYLTRAPVAGVLLLGWLALAWLSLLAMRNALVWVAVSTPLLLIAGYVWLSHWVFSSHNLLLPVALPVAGMMAAHGSILVERLVSEIRAKRRLHSIFGGFVARAVVDELIASGQEPKLGGVEKEITGFFSDIQGFSTFSEKLTPSQLVTLMNEYLSEMSDIFQNHGGTVDKYIGDAIVGMVGAPLAHADHAHRGCSAAIDIQRRQAELREVWRQQGGWPDIVYQMQTRIGLNSGPAVIGLMGSQRMKNYTMMGDNVNLAARCESGAKSYGVYTMVTEETQRLSVAAKDDIAFRYLDKTVVKGRTLPVGMYEVVGYTAGLATETSDCLDLFARAMEKYLAQDWDGAIQLFTQASALELFQPGKSLAVDTNPSLLMIQRCAAMKANPPGDGWDGVYVMKTK